MKKVLIIEDTLEVRENLAEILELSNYEVLTAENGKIGVKKALQHSPDVIICDVMMPELDGFGVLKILDSKPLTRDIPFIFLTAKADKLDVRKGMNLGADDYITKPFDDLELLDALEIRLAKSERIKKSFDGSLSGLNNFLNEASTDEVISSIIEDREKKRLKKKSFLYEEGQTPKRLYFVARGKLKTYKINDWGKELITGLFEEGEFVGYKDLVLGTEYEENAAALEESEIVYISKEDFFDLLYRNRDFAAKFIKMLTGNVKEKEERLISLAYNSIRKRVAEALLQVNTLHKGGEFSLQRDDLASIVGTAKESVIRTLADFKKEGIIAIEKGTINILDKGKLENLHG